MIDALPSRFTFQKRRDVLRVTLHFETNEDHTTARFVDEPRSNTSQSFARAQEVCVRWLIRTSGEVAFWYTRLEHYRPGKKDRTRRQLSLTANVVQTLQGRYVEANVVAGKRIFQTLSQRRVEHCFCQCGSTRSAIGGAFFIPSGLA
jgi:hypothetical protein